jgi:inorganic pyrophosphatase
MATENYPQEALKFQIQAFKKPKDIHLMWKTHVSFSGSPKKHPYDPGKVILVADPFSTDNLYYEFNKDDISYVEELPNLVNREGDTITMARVWVKKMSVGIRCSPFIVEDTRQTPEALEFGIGNAECGIKRE